jgi:hypothetical protein
MLDVTSSKLGDIVGVGSLFNGVTSQYSPNESIFLWRVMLNMLGHGMYKKQQIFEMPT